MAYQTTIELYKEDMKFSAGHYTIFSPTRREKLHGHNFRVFAAITANTDENGMAFDYAIYKKHLRDLCSQLNSCFLIAGNSNYQTIECNQDYIFVYFHNEKIPFLATDVKILPLKNITVEELARWFVDQLIADTENLQRYKIQKIEIKVFSGPGQSGSFCWNISD